MHPGGGLMASGCTSGRVLLWAFGDDASRASLLPSTKQPAHRTIFHESLSTPHWGAAHRLTFSRAGSRLGGIGEGGAVALWRADAPPAAAPGGAAGGGGGGMLLAEWSRHVLGSHGSDLVFLGDTGSQFVAAGQGELGGVVALWDTLLPPHAACVHEVRVRRHVPTALALLPDAPGAPLLVCGDDAGNLVGLDLRMMGASTALWSSRPRGALITSLATWAATDAAGRCFDAPPPAHPAAGAAAAASGAAAPPHPHPHGRRVHAGALVAAAGKDGSVVLVNGLTGELAQTVAEAHFTERRGPLAIFSGAGRGSAAPPASGRPRPRPPAVTGAAVTGLAVCEHGLMSCGMDGFVMLHPFSSGGGGGGGER